jgi:3-polyprenyl-4-hydroxybenzoate decarboxylase
MIKKYDGSIEQLGAIRHGISETVVVRPSNISCPSARMLVISFNLNPFNDMTADTN